MDNSERLLELIELGVVEHGGDLGGRTRLSGGTLQLFDGRVTLRAELADPGPAAAGKAVHAHVLTTLHEYGDELLDACVFGMGGDPEAALGEAALIWITGVAGLQHLPRGCRRRRRLEGLCPGRLRTARTPCLRRAGFLARVRRRTGRVGARRHETVVPLRRRVRRAAPRPPGEGFRPFERRGGLESRPGSRRARGLAPRPRLAGRGARHRARLSDAVRGLRVPA